MFRKIWLLLTLILLSVACIKEEVEDPFEGLPSRTVLVYLAADNDLSSDLAPVIEAIRRGWSYTGNQLLIYHDAADAAPHLLKMCGGSSKHPTPYVEVVEEYKEENSASKDVLKRVIQKVVTDYPADSYGLLFTSHASGWLPEGTLRNPNRSRSKVDPNFSPQSYATFKLNPNYNSSFNPNSRSIGKDSDPETLATSSTEMELSDFVAAIPDGQFNFIIFEACLMSGIEVAYELRDKTDYILASSAELLSPGFVPTYTRAIGYLFDRRQSTEIALRNFAESYYTYINTQSSAHRSTTLSILKTSELNNLATLAKAVFTNPAFKEISDITPIQHFDRPGSYGDSPTSPRYFDLEDYLSRVATPQQAATLSTQIQRTVVWKAATPTFMTGLNGFTIDKHCGLTVYIPQTLFPKLNESYRQSAWYIRTRN